MFFYHDFLQELAAGTAVLCGSVVLNRDPLPLQHHLASTVYETCRTGRLQLPNFPDYAPLVNALKENAPKTEAVVYKVCTQRHDRLLVLQSLARKFTEYEDCKEEANILIQAHNDKFNPGGEWMEDDERPGLTSH